VEKALAGSAGGSGGWFGVGRRLWLVDQRAVEDGRLDHFEFPGVVLRLDVDPQLGVVVLLPANEGLGRFLGEVAVHDFPALFPTVDCVVVEFAQNVPLIIGIELQKIAFVSGLGHLVSSSCSSSSRSTQYSSGLNHLLSSRQTTRPSA